MSAVILLPDVPSGMTEAKIYTSDDGIIDVLADTIPATNIEWESETTHVSVIIRVTFNNGGAETDKITVETFEQKLIRHIRNVDNILEDDLSDIRIDALFPVARDELILDICMYEYGEVLTGISDEYYQLPNRFIFDKNCAGAVSKYDIEFYTQTTPVVEYTEQVELVPVNINVHQRFVQLVSELGPTIQASMNYYYTGRRLTQSNLLRLLGAKVAAMHYLDEYNSGTSLTGTGGSSSSVTGDIEIGDIQVKAVSVSGTTAVAATSAQLKNKYVQQNSRYNKLVQNFKKGFYRVR